VVLMVTNRHGTPASRRQSHRWRARLALCYSTVFSLSFCQFSLAAMPLMRSDASFFQTHTRLELSPLPSFAEICTSRSRLLCRSKRENLPPLSIRAPEGASVQAALSHS
jgi:hypothetical protein